MTKTILSVADYQDIFNYSLLQEQIEIKSQVLNPELNKLTQVEVQIIGISENIDVESFSWFVKRMMDELEGFTRLSTDKHHVRLVYHPLFCYDQDNDYEGYKAIAQKTNSILADIFYNG